jgi:hypothetical protein
MKVSSGFATDEEHHHHRHGDAWRRPEALRTQRLNEQADPRQMLRGAQPDPLFLNRYNRQIDES